MAAIASRWLRRKAIQRWTASWFGARRGMSRDTVRSETVEAQHPHEHAELVSKRCVLEQQVGGAAEDGTQDSEEQNEQAIHRPLRFDGPRRERQSFHGGRGIGEGTR
jgi:hypothetical protein